MYLRILLVPQSLLTLLTLLIQEYENLHPECPKPTLARFYGVQRS
jgi:hypothetical protein